MLMRLVPVSSTVSVMLTLSGSSTKAATRYLTKLSMPFNEVSDDVGWLSAALEPVLKLFFVKFDCGRIGVGIIVAK